MRILMDMIQHSLAQDRLEFEILPYLLLVVASLMMWRGLYELLGYYYPKHSSEWHCRIVTTVHGFVVCALCLWILVIPWHVPFYHIHQGRASTHLMQFTFAISLAYFIFDLHWCLSNKTEGPMMLFHHVCSILGLGVGLLVGRWGTELTATCLGSELANPLLQSRWFIRYAGHGATQLAVVVDFLFISSFCFNRLFLGSFLIYSYMTNPNTDFLGRLGGAVIYSIGWIFWLQISIYAYRKFWKPVRRFSNSIISVNDETVSGNGDTSSPTPLTSQERSREGNSKELRNYRLINGVADSCQGNKPS